MAIKYEHLKEKARKLRLESKMSLPEICDCLSLPKSTIYYWVKDIKLQREPKEPAIAAMSVANSKKFAALREKAYQEGMISFDSLVTEESFRDFVVMYMAEGYKKCKNAVSLANSDPKIIKLANFWIMKFASNKVFYTLQYYPDQGTDFLLNFWCDLLNTTKDKINLIPKKNAGKLKGRNWNCRYGVMAVCCSDTYLRSKLQAWMDIVKSKWKFDAGEPVLDWAS